MKTRTKPKGVRSTGATLLKIDPSRTGDIRKKFEREVTRRLNRVKARIIQDVVIPDAFGLTTNVFCPTGEGGGVDPSCGQGGLQPVEKRTAAMVNEINALGPPLRGDNQRAIGGVAVTLKDKGWGVELVELKAAIPGAGAGTKVMKTITDAADKHSVTMTLKPASLDNPSDKEANKRLVKFYKRFGFKGGLTGMVREPKQTPTTNVDWSGLAQHEQVKAFQQYLADLFSEEMTGADAEALWEKYLTEALRRGATRAFKDVMQKKQAASQKPEAWKMGAQEQFLFSAFTQPVAKEKIQLILSRPIHELKGMTDASSQQILRLLADGLAQGLSPRQIGRQIAAAVDGIGVSRATTIARTEVIRAHAEGQLIALKQMGVEEVGAMIEWTTTKDGKTCPKCRPLQGIVLKIDEATGLLPRHPNCRCAWVPANVGEDPENQKRSKGDIMDAIKASKSYSSKKDKWGQDVSISKTRPAPLQINVDARGNPLDVVSAWAIITNTGMNCGTGAGGFKPGNTCSGGGIKLPDPPKFISSNKAAVAANEKAIGEMRMHAAMGNHVAVAAHPGTPSPKVQQHKQDLLAAIAKHTGVKVSTPPTPSPQEIPAAKGGVSVSAVKDHVMKATGYTHAQLKSLSGPANPKNKEAAVIRAEVTGAIYKGGHGIKDAALQVIKGDNQAAKMDLIKGLTTGNPARSMKEFADTPTYDLHVLSGITQSNNPVKGQAVCYMGPRVIEMGSTSVTGDYRHELGHAIRSALGGESPGGKTVITKAIHDDFGKVQEKVKADPNGLKMKLSHDEYETKYGVVGRRSLDNWEEHFAEHYRLYHREIYRDTKEGGNGKYLAQYRERHPEWAKIWDAHYTAALIGQQGGES